MISFTLFRSKIASFWRQRY